MDTLQASLPPSATVAVTGCTGLIGRRLTPMLLHAGYRVRVLLREPNSETAAGCQVVAGDLRDARSLSSLMAGADAVIHLAGIAHTRLKTAQEQAEADAVNVGGTQAILRASQAAGAKHMVFVSSAHVYRGQWGLNIREDDAKDAGTGYAAMKLRAEEELWQHAGTSLRLVVVRPCLTYGPGVRFNLQSLLRAVQAGRYVHPAGGDVMRSFASVDTAAAAMLHLLGSPAGAGTYNLADRGSVSLRSWVDSLADILGVRQPRAVPIALLRGAAAVGSVLQAVGAPAPLTTDSLRKLTAPFTLNVDRLAATGFQWPLTTADVLGQMVQHFQAEQRTGRPGS